MSADADIPTVTLHYAAPRDAELWHNGAGWYYTIDDLEDEGSVGAFDTAENARKHAERIGYRVADETVSPMLIRLTPNDA